MWPARLNAALGLSGKFMADGVRPSCFAIRIPAAAAVVLLASCLNICLASPPPIEETCEPNPADLGVVGPATTVARVEAQSLAQMKRTPGGVPQVPFGHANAGWLSLKRLMRPGDTVHQFRSENQGGYLVLREGCFIGLILEWAR